MAAVTHRRILASPERVFEVLSVPDTYGDWVVGSRRIRAADRGWPAAGTCFHHEVGVAPFVIRDRSTVVRCEPGRRLTLWARVRPLLIARVDLQLTPAAGGTDVQMTEEIVWGPAALVRGRITDLLVHRRNVRGLDRLARLAETGRSAD